MNEPTFRALLIGADHYFPNLLSNDATFRSLSGCVRDVGRMEATLRAQLSGRKLAITKLLAPNEGGTRPGGDEASWPTAANIRKALSDMAEQAKPGDQVFIHYSGHGGRVLTASKKLKGRDGIDETLVPIDIGVPDDPGGEPYTRPERYIRDVELAFYLDRLAQKMDPEKQSGVVVTLVFDSCHSGGATRGIEIATRCASGGTITEGDPQGTLDRRELMPSDLRDLKQYEEAFERLRAAGMRDAAASASWLPPAKGYVLLAACRDVESAIEASIDGNPRGGVLTDALLEALNAIGTEQSWRTIYDRILARVHSRFPSQTPQLLGETGRHVFGVDLQPIVPTLTVKYVNVAARTVTLSAGLAMMIRRGTEVRIHRLGENDFSAKRGVAVAKVALANDLDSIASLDPAVDLANVQVGAPVVVHRLPLQHKVALFYRDDLPTAIAQQQDAALSAVANAVATEASGFFEMSAAGETPDYSVALTEAGHYEIRDSAGEPYKYLDPPSVVGAPDVARSVIAKLYKLSKCQRLLSLRAPPSELPEQLDVQILAAPLGWDGYAGDPTASVGGTPLEPKEGCYTVKSDTWVWVRVKNKRPKLPVNIALIGIDRTYNIGLVVPNPKEVAGQKYETISDQPGTFAVRMYSPIPEVIVDTFKLFMTSGDVDFPALVQPELRLRDSQPATSVLGLMIDALARDEPRTRAFDTAKPSNAPWSVLELRVRTEPS